MFPLPRNQGVRTLARYFSRYHLSVLLLLCTHTQVLAEAAVDGMYVSSELTYLDMQHGIRPVDPGVKLELEFGVEHGKMKFIRIEAPVLEGIDRLYSRVRGMGCVYTSLGYPVMYPGAVIKVKTRREVFEIKYDSSGKNIFSDAFVVTNLEDGKVQTYKWKDQVGRIWFDNAPLKQDAARGVSSFHVSPTFLPENYPGSYRLDGDIRWFNDLTITLGNGAGNGMLTLGCPELQINFKLRKSAVLP